MSWIFTLLLSSALAAPPTFTAPAPASAPAQAKEAPPAPAQVKEVAVSASLVLKVPRPEDAANTLVKAVQDKGGWFASRSLGQVDLRVPVAELPGVLKQAESLGVVLERGYNANDLSFALNDARAKLAARESMMDKYNALLKTASVDAVLTVEQQVVGLVQEIESLKGQIRRMEDQANYARLTVSFRFPDRREPVQGGVSSFAWLNSLHLPLLLEDFRQPPPKRGRPGLGIDAPEGFAAYRGKGTLKATSPDGVVFRVREVKHKPSATLAFWGEALEVQLVKSGYKVMDKRDVQTPLGPGKRVAFAAPMGEEDWSYVVWVVPQGKKLVVIEAAGEVSRLAARAGAIDASVEAK